MKNAEPKRTHKVTIIQHLDAGVWTYYVDLAKYNVQQLLKLKQELIEELDIRDAATGQRFDDVPMQLPPSSAKPEDSSV